MEVVANNIFYYDATGVILDELWCVLSAKGLKSHDLFFVAKFQIFNEHTAMFFQKSIDITLCIITCK